MAEATVRALQANIHALVPDPTLRQHFLSINVSMPVGANKSNLAVVERHPLRSSTVSRRAAGDGDGCMDYSGSPGVCSVCGGGLTPCDPSSSCQRVINQTCAVMARTNLPPHFAYGNLDPGSVCVSTMVCVDCSGATALDRVPCPPTGYAGDNTSKVLLLLDNTTIWNLTGAFGLPTTSGVAAPYPQYLAGLSLVNSSFNGSQLRLAGLSVGGTVNMSQSTIEFGFAVPHALKTTVYGSIDLSYANVSAGLTNYAFKGSDIKGSLLMRGANVQSGISFGVFADISVLDVDLTGANVTGGIRSYAFGSSVIQNFVMTGADIAAGITNFAFQGTRFNGNVLLTGSDVSGGISNEAFQATTILGFFEMRGANISSGIMDGAFQRMYVQTYIDLSYSDISGGLSTECFSNLVTSSFLMAGVNLSGGITSSAFQSATFGGGFDLSHADVSNGIVRNVFRSASTFGDVLLVGADFSRGGIESAAFSGMTVSGTLNASGARFPNNTLPPQLFFGCNAQTGIDLSRCGIVALEARPCPSESGCSRGHNVVVGPIPAGSAGPPVLGGPFTGMSMPVGIQSITVDLSFNDLTEISETSLLGVTATTVNLSFNPRLAVFQPQWSLGVPNVRVIDTAGNPSTCVWQSGSDSITGRYTYAETASVICHCAPGTSGTGSFCAREPCNASLAALNTYAAATLGGEFSPGQESVPSGGYATLQCPSGQVPTSGNVKAQCLGGAFALQTNQCIKKKLSPGEIATIVLGCLAVAAVAGYFLLLSPERRKRRDLSYTLIDTKKQTELNERLLEETKGDLEEATALNSRMRGAWKIEEADVAIGDVLASGGFGVVHEGVFGGLRVAVKVLKRPLDEELYPDVGREFSRECETLMAARHASLLIFYGAGLTATNQPFMVTEFMSKGSLRAVLLDHAVGVDWGTRKKVALQIARAMEYLHGVGIVHRDLKSDNVLLNDQLDAKVCDFGTSRFLTSSRPRFQETSFNGGTQVEPSEALTATMTKGVGTILWMAPELFFGGAKYGPEVDVYSYGIIMWELLTRQRPWDHINETAYIQFFAALSRAFEAGDRPSIPDDVAIAQPELVQLMKQCWGTDPAARPAFATVALHLASSDA